MEPPKETSQRHTVHLRPEGIASRGNGVDIDSKGCCMVGRWGRRLWRNGSQGDGVLEAQGGLCPRGSVSSLREEPLEEMTCSVALSPGHVYAQHGEPLSLLHFLDSRSAILFLEFTTLTPVGCAGNWRLVLKRSFRCSNQVSLLFPVDESDWEI